MLKSFRLVSILCLAAATAVACGKKEEKPAPTPAPTPTPTPPTPTPPTPTTPTAPAAGGKGTIKGKVMFEGKAPEMKELPRFTADGKPKDANCATKEKANYLLVDASGGVADVLVRLPVGAAKGQAPAEPYIMDQRNCLYSPHVLGVIEGGKVAFKNSDPTMHNIHPFLPDGEWFNQAQQPKDPDIVKDIEASAGDAIKVKCDAHPWMLAYIVVTDHPHFVVTGADGSFELKDVPAGTYELEAWHPHMGVKKVSVTVEDGKEVEAKFPAFKPEDYKEPT